MARLVRHRLTGTEINPALNALSEWTPAHAPGGSLHPGDLGWALRFDRVAISLWTYDGEPIAVGFLDGDVLRVTPRPNVDLAELAVDVEQSLTPGQDRVDGVAIPGWVRESGAPWLVMSWTPQPVSSRATFVEEADAADRVLVQRSAFRGSTFTLDRWRTMKRSPAGALAVEMLVRTPAGQPAAAATGWFAGIGRCGLLEPVGSHPDHRGHGYGLDAVLGVCTALAQKGSSAVAVVTPSANKAAVALYRAAGFTCVRENHDWIRNAHVASSH